MEILTPRVEPLGAVLVIHSWWGLTNSFRHYGSRLVRAGYLVCLADLFAGRTAETEAEARRLRKHPRRVPMYRRLGENIEELSLQLGGAGRTVGVIGFSMGGHWAVWLSQRPEYQISKTILYYSARGGDFSNCKAEIQAHFAQDDDWVSKSTRMAMEKAIGKAGCTYQAFDYPGTKHWFAEATREAEFDRDAARLALDRDILFLEKPLHAAAVNLSG